MTGPSQRTYAVVLGSGAFAFGLLGAIMFGRRKPVAATAALSFAALGALALASD